jgi:hypothetical protein
MECEPTARFFVLKVAVPPLSVRVPNVVAPSLKIAVPVAIVAVGVVTVAVKVTVAPHCEGWADDATDVLLVTLFTTCATAPEALPMKVASPP